MNNKVSTRSQLKDQGVRELEGTQGPVGGPTGSGGVTSLSSLPPTKPKSLPDAAKKVKRDLEMICDCAIKMPMHTIGYHEALRGEFGACSDPGYGYYGPMK